MKLNIETNENGMELCINGITINIPNTPLIEKEVPVIYTGKMSVADAQNISKSALNENPELLDKLINECAGETESKSTPYPYQPEYLKAMEDFTPVTSKEAKTIVKSLKEDSNIESMLFDLALIDFNNNYKDEIVEKLIEQVEKKHEGIELDYAVSFEFLNNQNVKTPTTAGYTDKKAKTYSGAITADILGTTKVIAWFKGGVYGDPEIFKWIDGAGSVKNVVKMLKKHIKNFDDKILNKEVKTINDAVQFELRSMINRSVSKKDRELFTPTPIPPVSKRAVQKAKDDIQDFQNLNPYFGKDDRDEEIKEHNEKVKKILEEDNYDTFKDKSLIV